MHIKEHSRILGVFSYVQDFCTTCRPAQMQYLVVFYQYEFRAKYLCTIMNYYSIIIVLHNLEVHT